MNPTRFATAVTAAVLGCVPPLAVADDTPNLSRDELMQIVPGSHVVSTSAKGNIHRWTNDASGSFVANWESPPQTKRDSGNAPGTWKINGNGQYCVRIEWGRLQPEHWCAFLQKTADGKYGIATDGHSQWIPATFELSR